MSVDPKARYARPYKRKNGTKAWSLWIWDAAKQRHRSTGTANTEAERRAFLGIPESWTEPK